tara:strand:+ start:31191 stop:31499 length:309 start_codon:yes stop_codon:yes gene_type:complete
MSEDIIRVEVEHNPTDHFLTVKGWDADVNFHVIEGDETTYINICDVEQETISNGELDKNQLDSVRDFFIAVSPLTTKQALKLVAEALVKSVANESLRRIRSN